MSEKLKLWFFRDLNDEQRLKLFGLFDLPIKDIGKNHGKQDVALQYIMKAMIKMVAEATAPAPEKLVEGNLERATCLIKDAFEDAGHEVGGTFARRLAAEVMLLASPPHTNVAPIGWATVRVEDTCDGLLINADDMKRFGLRDDVQYEGHFLPDGRYRIAIRAALATVDKLTPSPQPNVAVTYTQAEYDEAYELGKRDGYEEAVQEIDQRTGGDCEYRVSILVGGGVDDERHTPDAPAMIQRIVDRFETLNLLHDAEKSGRDQEWGMTPSQHVTGFATVEDMLKSFGQEEFREGSRADYVTASEWEDYIEVPKHVLRRMLAAYPAPQAIESVPAALKGDEQ